MATRRLAGAFVAAAALAAPLARAATQGEVNAFLGGLTGKLVFVDKSETKAYWMNMANIAGGATKISDDTGVCSPLISPDGTYIAYDTYPSTLSYLQAISGGARKMLTANPAFAPHWYHDGSNLNVITCSMTDPTMPGGPGYTQIQQVDSSYNPSGTPAMFWSSRAMDAGITPDGKWLGEAYKYSYCVDLSTNRTYDWSWYQTWNNLNQRYEQGQTCNGSMSADRDRNWRMMTLKIPHTHICVWRFDQARNRWTLSKEFPIPDSNPEWQHPEWSNHPDFAVAITSPNGMFNGPIYLVNTHTGATLQVLDSDCQYPCLWLQASSPYILCQPGDLVFAAIEGGASPDPVTVHVTNWGPGTLSNISASISYDSGSGWLAATPGGSGNSQTLQVTANAGGLAAETYTATIALTSTGASNSPRSLPVRFEVLVGSEDTDGDGHTNEAEISVGSDPLDKYIYPSSDEGGGGCAAGGSAGPLASAWLAFALAGFAARRRS